MENNDNPIEPVNMQSSVIENENKVPTENISQDLQPKKKSKIWLWIIIGLITIGVIGIILFFILTGGEGSVVGNSLGSSVPVPPTFPN